MRCGKTPVARTASESDCLGLPGRPRFPKGKLAPEFSPASQVMAAFSHPRSLKPRGVRWRACTREFYDNTNKTTAIAAPGTTPATPSLLLLPRHKHNHTAAGSSSAARTHSITYRSSPSVSAGCEEPRAVHSETRAKGPETRGTLCQCQTALRT